jgi:phosphinothricin acetyltransferase
MDDAPTAFTLRAVAESDAGDICAIYNPLIASSIVTFEQEEVPVQDMAARIRTICSEYPYFVAQCDGRVIGYAYASRWRTRAAYQHTVETTVYVHPQRTQAGVGRALYARLLQELRARKFHAAIGGISLPNDASVRFHEAFGFQRIGIHPQVGRKFDRWVDVGFWQLLL